MTQTEVSVLSVSVNDFEGNKFMKSIILTQAWASGLESAQLSLLSTQSGKENRTITS